MIVDSSPQRRLRDMLRRRPGATLDEIRTFDPIFRSMSNDQLSVRLAQALDSFADERGK